MIATVAARRVPETVPAIVAFAVLGADTSFAVRARPGGSTASSRWITVYTEPLPLPVHLGGVALEPIPATPMNTSNSSSLMRLIVCS
jgi:hypothetical protein